MIKIFTFIFLGFLSLYARDKIVACNYTVLLDEAKTSVDLGLGRDLMNLFGENISTPIEIKNFKNIEELYKSAINKECDIIPFMKATPERKKYFYFTKPYFHIPLVMATKRGLPFINNMFFLEGKKIAGIKGHSYMQRLAQEYPNIKFIEVNSREDGLDMLRREEVFGFIDFAQILNYIITQQHMKDIAITAQFDENIPISIAVRNDDEELFKIFEDALAATKQEHLDRLMLSWYKIGYERKDNYKLIFQLSFLILLIIGILVYWNLLMKEIQAKREKKEAFLLRQNKLAQMGEMIENIAHQWRQPLAQINSSVLLINAFLYKSKVQNKDIDLKLTEIESQTKYMSKTIDDFKNFFHPNKNKEKIFLHPFFKEVLNITKGSLKSSYISVELNVETSLNLFGHKDELKQVIIFLLNNSIDAFGANKVKNPTITISAEVENGQIILKVQDNAGGIPEDIIDKIFDPYFTTKHKAQGTGLGLYMAKKIIEDGFNAKLNVHSNEGQTTFSIITLRGNDDD